MSVLKKSARHVVAMVGVICILCPGIDTGAAAQALGDGAWLELSSSSLAHSTRGEARVVIQQGAEVAALDAPYEIAGHGYGASSIKLRTHCGPMTFMVINGELKASDTERLGKYGGEANCGLGQRLTRAGAWHLVSQ